MRTRRFGRTGIQISEVVFGAGWVGGILIHQDNDTKHQAFHRALDAGINWIDTAADYGKGESERTIGPLMESLPVDARPRISTKARLDLNSSEALADQLRRSLEQSLERLRMDKVTLFQLHNPIAAESGNGRIAIDAVLGAGGVADALDRIRDDGLCDHIGFTALGDPACCIQVVDSGRFDSAQVYFNMLNPTAALAERGNLAVQDFSGLLSACARTDVAVMNIRVFAGGALASDVRHGREAPITPDGTIEVEAKRAKAALAVVDEQHGTRAQRALRFALAEPRVSGAVVGLAELSHLDEVLKAAEMGPLPESALAALRGVWDRNFGLASAP
ncbi:aldo/keto reductase [alpha proteobacterium BAL199]|jgi:D-threo-aldose 1-dehydrogenase|nr:aldo/keto reductase [alpha proteobacterium BAL199]